MKIILFGLLLFVLFSSVSAQPIFISPPAGRTLMNLNDLKKEELDVTKFGKPCGDYFLFEIIANNDGAYDEIISLDETRANGDRPGTSYFFRFKRDSISVKLDDKVKIPTAEWSFKGRQQIIIMMSVKDYLQADCLFN